MTRRSKAAGAKRRGTEFEREVRAHFERLGAAVTRSAASLGVDLWVALPNGVVRRTGGERASDEGSAAEDVRSLPRLLWVDCRRHGRWSPAELEGLIDRSKRHGATPVLAHWRDGRRGEGSSIVLRTWWRCQAWINLRHVEWGRDLV